MKLFPWFQKKEDVEMEHIFQNAHTIFKSPQGELVLEHLIEKAELEEVSGSLSTGEANYKNGYQDCLKYILVLANEITNRSNTQ